MQKLTIDINKLDRNKIKERKYTNRDGAEVTVRELELELYDLRQPKTRQAGSYTIVTTGFVKQARTKEERDRQVEVPGVGEVWHFEEAQQQGEAMRAFSQARDSRGEDLPF